MPGTRRRQLCRSTAIALEERYGTHAGYVKAVEAAAAKAVATGFLLQADADALVKQADASDVLNP